MNNIIAHIETMTEEEAVETINALMRHFDFSGTYFTRGDADIAWYNQQVDNDNIPAATDSVMDDETWERVRDTRYWRKTLPEILTERGWNIVEEAVAEALNGQ
jgi:hypothetical protein